MTIPSVARIAGLMEIGFIKLVIPKIKRMLKVLLPTMSPRAKSGLLLRTANKLKK